VEGQKEKNHTYYSSAVHLVENTRYHLPSGCHSFLDVASIEQNRIYGFRLPRSCQSSA